MAGEDDIHLLYNIIKKNSSVPDLFCRSDRWPSLKSQLEYVTQPANKFYFSEYLYKSREKILILNN